MYLEIKSLHSIIAYLGLALIVLSIAYNLYAWLARKPFSKVNKMLALLAVVSIHIQLLFGLVLYFISPLGSRNFSGAAMKDSVSRLYILEHPLMMILGVILITFAYVSAKKLTSDIAQYKRIVILYSLGLILILSRIPWSVW